jgi:putative redox protein
MAKPTVAVSLRWLGDLRFSAAAPGGTITVDGDSVGGPSPVETLAFSIAGCMAADVADIIRKGRFDLRSLTANLVAERDETHPRRVNRVSLRFSLTGTVTDAAVERAIRLSREKYCSVWHSMRTDIELLTSYEVRA